MSFVIKSSTYIELLLKEALEKESIPFEEQFIIYSGGRFSEAKYVADFLIKSEKINLIVECDGNTFHSGKRNLRKQTVRDRYLSEHGYKVIHFTTHELKYKMRNVIKCIRENLISNKLIKMSEDSKEHEYLKAKQDFKKKATVELFCYYMQAGNDVVCVYKYKSITKDVWSKERKAIIQNVPVELMPTVAIYNSLLDLTKKVKIIVHFCGVTSKQSFNIARELNNQFLLFSHGENIVKENALYYEYCNIDAYSRFCKYEVIETMKSLRQKCRRIAYQGITLSDVVYKDYNTLLK